MTMRPKPLDGQVVVSGASSGSGLAIAASRGVRGAQLARGAATLQEVVVAIGERGGRAISIALDVADRIAGSMVDRRQRDPPPCDPMDAPHRPGDTSTRDWMAWASAEDPPRACRAPGAPSGPAPVAPVAAPPDPSVPRGCGPDAILDAASSPARGRDPSPR